jgi:hypothetical protein
MGAVERRVLKVFHQMVNENKMPANVLHVFDGWKPASSGAPGSVPTNGPRAGTSKALFTGAGALHTFLIDFMVSFNRPRALLVGCGSHSVSVSVFLPAVYSANSGTAFLELAAALRKPIKGLENHLISSPNSFTSNSTTSQGPASSDARPQIRT